MKIRSQSGMTLAELAVVISIFGVLLAVSVPAFVKRNEKQKLQVAANMFSNKIMLARQKAVATKKRYRILINYSTNEFRIQRRISPGVWESDPPNNRFAMPQGIYLSSTSTPVDGSIEIQSRGTIDQSDLPVVIKLKDRNNTLKSVLVSRSGMVSESSYWD